MDNKHTKGPWHTEPLQADEGGSIAVVAPLLGVIAIVPPDPTGDFTPETDQANARLIAAAPDLFQAAVDALESLKRLPDTPDAYRVTCIQQLEAAISKATQA